MEFKPLMNFVMMEINQMVMGNNINYLNFSCSFDCKIEP